MPSPRILRPKRENAPLWHVMCFFGRGGKTGRARTNRESNRVLAVVKQRYAVRRKDRRCG
jgi:hypothetical protein